MPTFLGICGVLEIATGLVALAAAASAGHQVVAVLLIALGILTFGFGGVVYELQLIRRQMREPERDPKKTRLW